ncbi:MAG: biopolymer transporter ExbD [Proteobacteria bacterium]|nr:biopolymer transporter ExbD [Pseudomonadota bacterium]
MIQLPEVESRSSLMPDMTALLDVIFILLIFMMLTANVAPQLLELDLPQASAPAKNVEENAITLGISEQRNFSINQQKFESWDKFEAALTTQLTEHQQQYGTQPQMLVTADKDVALQPFVRLANWLSQQGIAVAEVVVSDQQ